MTKSRDCSDAGTSQERGIPQSWRRQGVQLLATGGSLALPMSQFWPSGTGLSLLVFRNAREYTSVALSHQFCGHLGHRSRRGGYGPVHTAPGCHRGGQVVPLEVL